MWSIALVSNIHSIVSWKKANVKWLPVWESKDETRLLVED